MIQVGDFLACYLPKSNLLQKISDRARWYQQELQLRPDQCWFRRRWGRPWSDLLDPAFSLNPTSKWKIVVRREGADHIVFERDLAGKHSEGLRATASLVRGGNIVEYQSLATPQDGFSSSGNYEWVADGDGRWRLGRYEFTRGYYRDSTLVTEDSCSISVTSFAGNIVPPPPTFDIDAIKLPVGTRVEEISQTKRSSFRVGGKRRSETVLGQQALDELSSELRSQGFAAPNDDK
jgi:hypothetical protein